MHMMFRVYSMRINPESQVITKVSLIQDYPQKILRDWNLEKLTGRVWILRAFYMDRSSRSKFEKSNQYRGCTWVAGIIWYNGDLGVGNSKIWENPKIIHFHMVFHCFHHPFWGTSIFGNIHLCVGFIFFF